jgi:hypothetical protein
MHKYNIARNYRLSKRKKKYTSPVRYEYCFPFGCGWYHSFASNDHHTLVCKYLSYVHGIISKILKIRFEKSVDFLNDLNHKK